MSRRRRGRLQLHYGDGRPYRRGRACHLRRGAHHTGPGRPPRVQLPGGPAVRDDTRHRVLPPGCPFHAALQPVDIVPALARHGPDSREGLHEPVCPDRRVRPPGGQRGAPTKPPSGWCAIQPGASSPTEYPRPSSGEARRPRTNRRHPQSPTRPSRVSYILNRPKQRTGRCWMAWVDE